MVMAGSMFMSAAVVMSATVTSRLLQRSPHQLSEHDQQIHRRKHQAEARHHRVPRPQYARESRHRLRLRGETSQQAEELTDDAIEAGKTEAREGEEHHEERPNGHLLEEAAQLLHVLGVIALVDHADAEEERARRQAMVDHVHDRTSRADRVEREESEHAEAEMAH